MPNDPTSFATLADALVAMVDHETDDNLISYAEDADGDFVEVMADGNKINIRSNVIYGASLEEGDAADVALDILDYLGESLPDGSHVPTSRDEIRMTFALVEAFGKAAMAADLSYPAIFTMLSAMLAATSAHMGATDPRQTVAMLVHQFSKADAPNKDFN